MARRGRKPKGEYVGKTEVFSTRLRPDTKAAIVAAAAKSGRSMSQEVEHRLRRSFDEDRDLIERFGGRQNYAMLRLIGSCLDVNVNPNDLDSSWLDDPYVFEQTVKSVVSVLGAFRPPGDPEFKDPDAPMLEAAAPIQGMERAAYGLFEVISASDQVLIDASGSVDVASAIKDDLGPLIKRVRIVRGNAEDLRRAAEELERREKEGTKK